MSKVCKFCNTENEDTEDFCTKCGTKLIAYQQYKIEIEKNKKKTSINFNFRIFFTAVIILIMFIVLSSAFFFQSEEDKLPNYAAGASASRSIENIVSATRNNNDYYTFSVNTTPAALSFYLTSIINPATQSSKNYSETMSPRIIVKPFNASANEIFIVFRNTVNFIDLRILFKFSCNEKNKWELKSFKLGNWPHMSLFKDKIFNKISSKILQSAKLEALLNANYDFYIRNKNSIKISISKGQSPINTDNIK